MSTRRIPKKWSWANNHKLRGITGVKLSRNVVSHSSEKTKKLGEELARKYVKKTTRKGALIFALTGELGSGKTTFTQGFLHGLGLKKRTTSPTFIIMRRFRVKGHGPRVKNLYHIDAYRIKNPHELMTLGIKEIFSDAKNIVLVEWADKIKKILPKNVVSIKFSHGKKENERAIKIS